MQPTTSQDLIGPDTANSGITDSSAGATSAHAFFAPPRLSPQPDQVSTDGPTAQSADLETDLAADPTASLRAAANALTMHVTIHSGIAEFERTLHNDGEPNEAIDDLHARIASLAPRHQAVADAARDVAAALRAIVDAIDHALAAAADHHALSPLACRPADTEGGRITGRASGPLTLLYRIARHQIRTSWPLLPEP